MDNLTLFRIGTRGSPLALKQADILKNALQVAHPDLKIEIVPIKSAADWKKSDGEKPLYERDGGKGQFAKEIEQALLEGAVDCGVHSLKDMAAFLPEGLEINHYLPRSNPLDAFISRKYQSIAELPEGSVIGTCSVRRQALLLAKCSDLKIVPFRGNVQTRLDKVEAGQVDGTFLAMAGLERLGISNDMIHPLSEEEMLPACGQGIVCIEIRSGDERAHDILDPVHCQKTGFCAAAEREVLKVLSGSCHTPVGVYAQIENGVLILRAVVASLDGRQVFEERAKVACSFIEEAKELGLKIGTRLKAKVPQGILS